ncbi:MAG: hypothetical protein J6X06_06485, partial [Elusimicrobiaceae bacterium]|nr:hypothetical protein [Elusimicrobiaceae bacterium]
CPKIGIVLLLATLAQRVRFGGRTLFYKRCANCPKIGIVLLLATLAQRVRFGGRSLFCKRCANGPKRFLLYLYYTIFAARLPAGAGLIHMYVDEIRIEGAGQ